MISCDEATLLSDKSQYENLDLSNQFKLKIHLFMCNPCNTYHKQNKIITEKINEVKNFPTHHTSINRLSEEKKEIIKKEIDKKI